jgi:hypothetical protein
VQRALVLILLSSACRLHFGEHDDAGTAGDGHLDGAPPPYEPTWTSGTRMRARLWSAVEGGDPIFAGFRDTVLDTDCQGIAAADGIERCLPIHIDSSTYFSDAGCTQPLAVIFGSPCGHDRYASSRDTAQRTHVFPIGGLYTGPIYDSRAGCTMQGIPAGSTPHVLAGGEAAPSQFAATSYQNVMVGGYLHVFVGYGDGSSLFYGTIANSLGACKPVGGELGTTQCRPTSALALQPVYSDAACSQRAYLAADPTPITTFLVDDLELCGRTSKTYQVTANVTGPFYWVSKPGGCTQTTTPTTGRLYTATQIADPYPTGTVAPGPRRGRLGKLMWTGDDGIAIELAYWDHQLHRSCYPFTGGDGRFRCLPRQPKLVRAYESSTCSGTNADVASSCYGVPPLDGPPYASCDDQAWQVRELPMIGAASVIDETACRPLSAPGGVYEEGTGSVVIPAATFPELVETIE